MMLAAAVAGAALSVSRSNTHDAATGQATYATHGLASTHVARPPASGAA